MATYYVRTSSGNDTNNGTSPATAWKTIGKALGSAGIASGDTVYVGAGTYRETVSVAMTSATVATSVIADTDGSQTGDAGDVILTAYTTSDTTAPAATVTLNLAGRSFLTFQGFTIIGGNANPCCVAASTSNSHDITFRQCTLIHGRIGSGGTLMAHTAAVASTATNWLIDRCLFVTNNALCIGFTLVKPTSGTFNYNEVVRNSQFFGTSFAAAVQVSTTGANTGTAGGVSVINCTCFGVYILQASDAGVSSTTNTCVASGNLCWTAGNAMTANTAGQVASDHNLIYSGGTAFPATVTAGTGDVSNGSYAPLFSFGQEALRGANPRPFLTPLAGSPALGFGNVTGADTVDWLNRPRPAGGQITNAVGALERHDTAQVGANLGADSGGYTEMIGPGDQEYFVWCGAQATTISVKVKWDANYANTNKPQLVRVANAAIGVTADTQTAVGTAGSAYETLSTTFTPTAAGLVRVRVVSRSAAANGVLAFDTWSIS